MQMMLYIFSYLIAGFALGLIHYFRNKLKDIGALSEVIAVAFIWPLLGLFYLISEIVRIWKVGDGQ